MKPIIYVFGSNESGFHGAGQAGNLFKGTYRNDWRKNKKFQYALKTRNYKGDYCELYKARGFQVGNKGCSYGIVTIKKPGELRSVSLSEIKKQLIELNKFAKSHPAVTIILPLIGTGYAGYDIEEINQLFDEVDFVENVKRVSSYFSKENEYKP